MEIVQVRPLSICKVKPYRCWLWLELWRQNRCLWATSPRFRWKASCWRPCIGKWKRDTCKNAIAAMYLFRSILLLLLSIAQLQNPLDLSLVISSNHRKLFRMLSEWRETYWRLHQLYMFQVWVFPYIIRLLTVVQSMKNTIPIERPS